MHMLQASACAAVLAALTSPNWRVHVLLVYIHMLSCGVIQVPLLYVTLELLRMRVIHHGARLRRMTPLICSNSSRVMCCCWASWAASASRTTASDSAPSSETL